MRTPVFHFAFFAWLSLILSPLAVAHASSSPADSVHFCAFDDYEKWRRDHPRPAGKVLEGLNRGEPRTVRLIYFLPNDRPFRAAAIPRIKDEIRKAQTFFAEQMQAHGYGNRTFRIETDVQGEPLVHRVVGQHPESHYFATIGGKEIWQYYHFPELEQTFDFYENVYVIYSDTFRDGVDVTGGSSSKKSGWVDFNRTDFDYSRWQTLAHELGHAFGLGHDFRDGAYLMSYGGPSQLPGDSERISAYAAEFLSVHSYFNDAIPIEDYPPSALELNKSDDNRPTPPQDNRSTPRRFPGKESSPPTIKLISPTESSSRSSSWGMSSGIRVIPTSYPAGSKSISVQLKVGDAEGLHQVSFHDRRTLREYRSFDGARNTVVDFDYDGSPTYADPFRLVSSLSESPHLLEVRAVDTDGNMSKLLFELVEVEAEPAVLHSLAKVSGDGQEGRIGAALARPFVVSVLDQYGVAAGAVVSFSVTAGGGTLSSITAITDANGRARSTLTLGDDPGTNAVAATVGGLQPVTFTAIGQATTDSDGEIADDESSGEDQPESEEQPTTEVALEGISSSHDSVRENDEQATVITLTVTLAKAAAADETITLAIVSPTQGKTAKRNEDFDATLPETLTIAKGQRTGTAQLTLTPKDNTTADGDKAFAVQATSSSGHAALINIKIIDNDSADEPQARLTPDPAGVAFSADDPVWKTFTVHTSLDSVLVRANPSGSDPAIEVAGGQQVPTRDFCPAEGNDRPTRGRRDGWSLHVKACQAGQTKIQLIDYDTGEVVQQYEINVEASTGTLATTRLNPSYPNPFNSETVLSYTLSTASDIRLEVFTLNGQRVAVLHEGFQAAGYHTIAMDASDWASGVYFYRLTTPEGRFAHKFTLLR